MENSPSPQSASQSLDPDLLAALTKLADGCDELRRWALTMGSKLSTQDSGIPRSAIDKSSSQLQGIIKDSKHADTSQADDRPVKHDNGLQVSAGRSSLECSTVTPRQEPVSGAKTRNRQSNPSPSVVETSSRQEAECILMDLHQGKATTQEMKKVFIDVLHNLSDAEERFGKMLVPKCSVMRARDEIDKAWPQDLIDWPLRPWRFTRFSPGGEVEISIAPMNPYGAFGLSYPNLPFSIRHWRLSDIKTSTFHFSLTAIIFQIFLCSHDDSNVLRGRNVTDIVLHTMTFIYCIQRPGPINSDPVYETTNRLYGMVVWSIRACQAKGLMMRPAEPEASGFPLHRERGWIGSTNRRKGFPFQEWRGTACLYTRLNTEFAMGSVVLWLDTDAESFEDGLRDMTHMFPKTPQCGKDGGAYTLFCAELFAACKCWYSVWTGTMDMIDDLVSIKPTDTLNKDYWQTLMFDSEFQVSETYFSVLQMLRIFDDWIEETVSGWREVYGRVYFSSLALNREHPSGVQTGAIIKKEVLDKSCQEIESFLRHLATTLHGRIEKKRVEVESLRDGLFNAASLREAVNARTLNLFVIIFTVVTIIYTPLGFLAALWAMSNLSSKLDGDKDAPTPTSFIASWIALPLGTYLASTIFLFVAWVNTSPDGGSFWLRARHKMSDLSKRLKGGHFKLKLDRIKYAQQQLKRKLTGFWSKIWKRPSGADVERGHDSRK